MDINQVVNVFVTVVVQLMNHRLSNGSKIYVETKNGMWINFRPQSFKKKLKSLVGEDLIYEYLDYFRRLELIVVSSGEKRFTNITWINKKTIRVITVERKKLETLIELINNSTDKD